MLESVRIESPLYISLNSFMSLNAQQKILVAPSLLSADFGCLNEDIASVEKYSDLIHVDVMDGHFVPNISLGVPVIESIKSSKPLDVHLMIQNPEKYLSVFANAVKKAVGKKLARRSYLVVHLEAVDGQKSHGLLKIIQEIHDLGMLAGVALNPDTSLKQLHANVLKVADMIVLMTVFPGFGGQKFIAAVLPKIRALRDMMPQLNIEVDGGITQKTAPFAVEAGANILVSGSFVFGSKNRRKVLEDLKKI